MTSKVSQRFAAIRTHLSFIKSHKTVSAPAERAAVFLLQDDDTLTVQTDLQRIA